MGREEHQEAAQGAVRVGVLTISDTRTQDTDTSGQYLMQQLQVDGHVVVEYRIVKDDALEIRSALSAMMKTAQVILSSGGTGITGRDVTIPVVESLLTKPMPGFGELFRMLSYQQVKGAAMLSRAVGGLARNTLIFALPGSQNAAQTAWEGLLRDELSHLVFEMTRQPQPLSGSSVTLPSGSGPLHVLGGFVEETEGAADVLEVEPPKV
ncbi:MogA/MoaB family molybdenum cofactor biosynthesis protein [Deinococcus sp. KNUC1210]|uniref:MogA/MoaB family molybdenum cofactor biosynthesis protein n=1 Tax=Deinococcus sp. KNUC1210 TaxID=2917691 RepID=UPI001EEF85FE|nr:MogA/MoaB family molybdenum cofactor biosynthesis protein [Deinococcus sp. KNUC1210]ULH15686.1 MogA/MoaB family molybdenum cofactor biosynthesis protein [Deinococcus sp. KNUC1210]